MSETGIDFVFRNTAVRCLLLGRRKILEKSISYYWKEGAKQHLQRAHIVFKDVQIDLIAV